MPIYNGGYSKIFVRYTDSLLNVKTLFPQLTGSLLHFTLFFSKNLPWSSLYKNPLLYDFISRNCKSLRASTISHQPYEYFSLQSVNIRQIYFITNVSPQKLKLERRCANFRNTKKPRLACSLRAENRWTSALQLRNEIAYPT